MRPTSRRIHTVRLVVLAAVLSACSPRPDRIETPQEWHDAALEAFRRGELAAAEKKASAGSERFQPSTERYWHWKFRILLADIRRTQARLDEALDLVRGAGDSGCPPELAPEALLVQARSEFSRGSPATGATIETGLALAGRLSQRSIQAQFLSLKGITVPIEQRATLFRSALALATEAGDDYAAAAILNNLGSVNAQQGRPVEAIEWFGRALTAADKSRAELHASRSLMNLAICFEQLGDYDKALDFIGKAINRQETGGAKTYLLDSLGQAGNIYLRMDEPDKAIPYLQKAVNLAREVGQPSDVALWLTNLAQAQIDRNDFESAAAANAEALRLKGSDDAAILYSKLNSAQIALGLGRAPEAQKLFTEVAGTPSADAALGWEAEHGLGRLYAAAGNSALAARHFQRAIRAIEESELPQGLNDYQLTFLRNRTRVYSDYVDHLMSTGAENRALEVAESAKAGLLQQRLHLRGTTSRAFTIRDYRHVASARGATLWCYWLGRRGGHVWVVSGDRIQSFNLPAAGAIYPLLRSHQNAIAGLRDLAAAPPEPSRQLFEILVRPVLQASGTTVIVVPDGALHSLNFETLPHPDTGRFLIETHTISVAASANLVRPGDRTALPMRGRLLVVGDAIGSALYPRLPHAGDEIEGVVRGLASLDADVLRGAQARPDAYTESQPGRYSIIHFAAHAASNPQSPLDAAVLLSPEPGSGEPSRLHARQLLDPRLALTAALVTVSACRSAGEQTLGGEGLVGFTWAFMQAGARTVIAGLWDVGDRSTAELMESLYRGIGQGLAADTALRQAKLRMIQGGSNYRKPFYWGPFLAFTRG